ncbi:MAG: gamma-glutamyl-gamma-aminobutyrate hydrolase family protein [Patescibacteria group bacterium]
MNILVSQRSIFSEGRGAKDGLEREYVRYYSSFGITLIPVPNVPDLLSEYCKLNIHGVLLSGGDDICMDAPHSPESACSCARTEVENGLLRYAIEKNIPLLAECRGCQLLNLFFGGSLVRNIQSAIGGLIEHVGTMHMIEIVDKNFRKFLGMREVRVNSYHNHGFTEESLSSDLLAFARTSDGVIEGVYHPSYPLIGIMWHPERGHDDNDSLNSKIVNLFMGGMKLAG